jgi:hypothetical protein
VSSSIPYPVSSSSSSSANLVLTQPVYEMLEEVFDLHERGWISRQTVRLCQEIVEVSFDGTVNEYLYQAVSE